MIWGRLSCGAAFSFTKRSFVSDISFTLLCYDKKNMIG